MPLPPPNHITQTSKFLAGQPDLLQSLYSTRQLSLTVAVWVKVINQLKNTLAAEGVFWKGTISVECNNLSLNLEGIFSHAPDMCIHKNIIGFASPWMVLGLILPPTRMNMSYRASNVTVHSWAASLKSMMPWAQQTTMMTGTISNRPGPCYTRRQEREQCTGDNNGLCSKWCEVILILHCD